MSTELEISLETEAQEIRQLLKRTTQNVVDIGVRLLRIKEVAKGTFTAWVENELGIDLRTAQNFMSAATRFHDRDEILSRVEPTALYLLAAPSTPDELIKAVEQGEIEPTVSAIKEAKREYQEPREENATFLQGKLSTRDLTKQIIALVQSSQLYETSQINQADVNAMLAKVSDGFWGGKRKKTFTALSLLCQALEQAIK